jgi:hypothetical protein
MPAFFPNDPSIPLSGARALLAAHDWRAHPLGHPDTWPPELATAVRMALDSAFPMFVAWGADLRLLYNDAYAALIGDKHPAALAEPFQQVWAEIWVQLLPIIDMALSGESAFFEDLPLIMQRRGHPEQAYFTFSYSPLQDGKGGIAGMYCTAIETTERVHAERRAALELKLSDASRSASSPEEVLAMVGALLGEELGLTRAIYAEVDDAAGTFTVSHQWVAGGTATLSRASFAFDDFGPTLLDLLRAGETIVIDDAFTDPRCVDFPLRYCEERIGAALSSRCARN